MPVTINRTDILKTMNYEQYRKLINDLMADNKTTGTNQSEEIIQYARMNIFRMDRLDNNTTLNPELLEALQQVPNKLIWLVLTEGWCGDAAQIVPVLERMADSSPNIDLMILLRDENLDLMDRYLTNGTRSIPKLICLHADTLKELGTWGPRPQPAQQLLEEHRARPNADYKEFAEKLHAWYAKDRTQTIQQELLPLIKQWSV
jgi:hypothetical protein